MMAHIVLLLLVTREDTDFTYVSVQKTVEYGIAERTGTTGD
jgi:hypothetical protein